MTVETISEFLFKRHCAQRNVPCSRIPENGGKVADFELTLDYVVAVAEVKQLDPNEHDLARESFPPGEIAGAGFAPTTRLRNLLGSAYRQIKPYAANGLPGIVVCYNNAGGINHIDNFTVTRAMFGGMAVYIALGQDGIIHRTGQGFTDKRKVTRNTLRGLSAVCVLSSISQDATKLVAYHNPYAARNLLPATLRALADAQFGYVDPHGQINPQFLAHELEV